MGKDSNRDHREGEYMEISVRTDEDIRLDTSALVVNLFQGMTQPGGAKVQQRASSWRTVVPVRANQQQAG